MELLNIRLNITPHGKMRPRFGARGRFARAYKAPQQVRQEETLLTLLAPHQPPMPFEGPLSLRVQVFKPIPKSFSKKKRGYALDGLLRPTTKPDLDNVIKHVKDCLTQLRFWEDDKQVVEYLQGTGAWYSDQPGYGIVIWG